MKELDMESMSRLLTFNLKSVLWSDHPVKRVGQVLKLLFWQRQQCYTTPVASITWIANLSPLMRVSPPNSRVVSTVMVVPKPNTHQYPTEP